MMLAHVARYLAVRRAAGFALRETGWFLADFAAFATSRDQVLVHSPTAIEWAAQARTPRMRQERHRSLRLFARYLHSEDPRHEIPPAGVFVRPPPRPMPHIFTPDEAQRLVIAAAHLGPQGSNRGPTTQAVLALLFATGLRISEALGLRLDDFRGGCLLIRETKFRKTRLVPLHTSAVDGLSEYIGKWRRGAGVDAVFVGTQGKPLTYRAIERRWRLVIARAKVKNIPGRMGPRIHDIRHTFAVRALEAAPNGRDRVSRHTLAVSTYLGHTCVTDTYWYFHVSPTLMVGVADACQSLFEGGRS